MSKRRYYKKNSSVKKFFRKPIVMMISVALVVVALCGMLGNLTDGFTNFDSENLKDKFSTMHINKDNLFYDVIEDKVFLDNNNAKVSAENGVLTVKASITDNDTNAITIAEAVTFATIKLEKGTYTLSAYDKADRGVCCVVGTFNANGSTHTWYGDYTDKQVDGFDTSATSHGQTVTLESDTEVTFVLRICEGAELDNVKIMPVLVEGENEGNYYAGILGLIG